MNKKKIFFLSVGRSDFSRYLPIIDELNKHKNTNTTLIVTGAHFDSKFGNTFDEIKKNKVNIKKIVSKKNYNNTDISIQNIITDISILLSKYLAANKPDMLVLSGDRYEMLAGSISSLGMGIPIIHIHGGAVTEGAIDELVRHAITKMSHFHYVIHDIYKKRLMQLGEEKWRIKNYGAPGLDYISKFSDQDIKTYEEENRIKMPEKFCLACYHPVTLELIDLKKQIKTFLNSLRRIKCSIIFTYPNADPGTIEIIKELEKFKKNREDKVFIIKNAGSNIYNYLMSKALFMVGNSSSGIVEAASFKLPVINIGTRQKGKIHPINVINVKTDINSIIRGIKKSQTLTFNKKIRQMTNPYGNGRAGRNIAKSLLELKTNIGRT